MARIRTIKPEFFTSEDIVSLSPLARLLYIAIWCEADREGRLIWKPRTFKLRYLPADNCDAEQLAQELVDAGLVVLYGQGYAFIPTFGRHQHLNPRESASQIPSPSDDHASPRVATRQHASNLDVHAQGGREGKGKEGKESASALSAREPSKAGAVGMALKAAGIDPQSINLSDPVLLALIEQGATPEEFGGLAAEAIRAGKRNPIKWVLAVLPERRKDAAATALAPAVTTVQGESVEQYQQRIAAEKRAERERLAAQKGPSAEVAARLSTLVGGMRAA